MKTSYNNRSFQIICKSHRVNFLFKICSFALITARVRSTREGNVLTPVCVSVHTFGGGVPGLRFSGGVPGFRFLRGYPVSDFQGGYLVSDFWGGPRSEIFRGGTWSQIFGGVSGLSKGKNF